MLNFMGLWSPSINYSVGNAVEYTDKKIYHLQKRAPKNEPPTDTRYWSLVTKEVAESILAMYRFVDSGRLPDQPIGNHSYSRGNTTVASGANSTAIGQGIATSGFDGETTYSPTKASGRNSVAIGQVVEARGTNSVALGKETRATEENSIACGYGTVANDKNMFVCGRYNNPQYFPYWIGGSHYNVGDTVKLTDGTKYKCIEENSDMGFDESKWQEMLDQVFVVGCGTDSNNRKDGFSVNSNGSITLNGVTLTSDALSELLMLLNPTEPIG